jgi:hypothetical protein
MLRQIGLEIFTENSSYLYSFRTPKQRDEFYNILVNLPLCKKNLDGGDVSNMTLKWQSGEFDVSRMPSFAYSFFFLREI